MKAAETKLGWRSTASLWLAIWQLVAFALAAVLLIDFVHDPFTSYVDALCTVVPGGGATIGILYFASLLAAAVMGLIWAVQTRRSAKATTTDPCVLGTAENRFILNVITSILTFVAFASAVLFTAFILSVMSDLGNIG